MNQMTRIASRTSIADRAGRPGIVIRYRDDELEAVNLAWGLRPKEEGDTPYTTVRAEGRAFPSHRCLLPASEFSLEHEDRRWRFSLPGDEHFFFAGIWRPASRDWPESYAILTIEAGQDVAPYRDRQMAVIRRADRYAWLHHEVPEDEILRPLPPRSFRAEIDGPAQGLLL